jgi:hypothetical protein
MIRGVGSVSGLTLMIVAEELFVWCAVTPTSACKHCQQCLCTVPTLSTRRIKNVESPEKTNTCFPRDRKPPQNAYSTEPGRRYPASYTGWIGIWRYIRLGGHRRIDFFVVFPSEMSQMAGKQVAYGAKNAKPASVSCHNALVGPWR